MRERSLLDQEGALPWLGAQARQTVRLRYFMAALATGIIVFLLWMAGAHALSAASFQEPSCYLETCPEYNGIPLAILISSPILAATAITIFLLIGVFQRFGSKEAGSPPAGAIAEGAAEGMFNV